MINKRSGTNDRGDDIITSYEARNNPMFLRNQFKGVGMFHLPLIKKQRINLENIKLIGYDKINQDSDRRRTVHFYLDDYKINSVYTHAEEKAEILKQFNAVLTPDFSMYSEMPTVLQLFSCFKNRWVGAFLQSKGATVIPSVRWGGLESFNYCFDGIEKGSIVAVSTIGMRKNKGGFMLGYNEMMRRIKPEAVICYGKIFDRMNGNIVEIDYGETNNLLSTKENTLQTEGKYIINKFSGHVMSTQKGGGSAGGYENGNPEPKAAEKIDFNEKTDMPEFPGWDNKSPGEGFEWRGNGSPESNKGSWYNSVTGEKYYYDIEHPQGIGPHWDYYNPNGWGNGYRIFSDGSWTYKIFETENNTLWKTWIG